MDNFFFDFFLLNLKDYVYIGVDFYINLVLLAIVLALCASCFVINHGRSTMQTVIKQLARHGATSEDSAKTLGELGLADSAAIKRALSGSGRLMKLVGRVGEKVYTYEEYTELSRKKGGIPKEAIDFSQAQFYIRPGEDKRAKFIIDSYGTSTLRAILYCVLFLAVYSCIALCMPEILTFINNFLGGI